MKSLRDKADRCCIAAQQAQDQVLIRRHGAQYQLRRLARSPAFPVLAFATGWMVGRPGAAGHTHSDRAQAPGRVSATVAPPAAVAALGLLSTLLTLAERGLKLSRTLASTSTTQTGNAPVYSVGTRER